MLRCPDCAFPLFGITEDGRSYCSNPTGKHYSRPDANGSMVIVLDDGPADAPDDAKNFAGEPAPEPKPLPVPEPGVKAQDNKPAK